MNKILLLGLALLCIGCEKTKKDSTAEVAEQNGRIDLKAELALIEETRAGFQLAIKEKRYKDLFNYSTQGMLSVTPGGEKWSVFNRLKENPRGEFSYDSIQINPKETVILNDSIAYDFGTSKVFYTNEEGSSIELENSFLLLLKKDSKDKTWKLFREVASSELPAFQ